MLRQVGTAFVTPTEGQLYDPTEGEVLDRSDDNYWMATAYTIPDTPPANVAPGQTGIKMVPISRIVPRSFFTNVTEGASLPAGVGATIRGIAFGGDTGVAKVELTMDAGRTWQLATLGEDHGKYSFRRWQVNIPQLVKGHQSLIVRCTSLSGDVQPAMPSWNDSGFMLNAVETTHITAI